MLLSQVIPDWLVWFFLFFEFMLALPYWRGTLIFIRGRLNPFTWPFFPI